MSNAISPESEARILAAMVELGQAGRTASVRAIAGIVDLSVHGCHVGMVMLERRGLLERGKTRMAGWTLTRAGRERAEQDREAAAE